MKQTSVADDVLRAALGLFAAQGYANTSVQQVVEAAGVTKGAMYHYFQSKDDLLFAIYDRMLTLQTDHLETIVARGEPVDATLRKKTVPSSRKSIDVSMTSTHAARSVASTCSPRATIVSRWSVWRVSIRS